MKGLITSLVVLAVLTVMAIPTYGKGKGVSKLKVIDANGLVLGSVVGIAAGGDSAQVETTVGGELVILGVSGSDIVRGTNVGNLRFKEDNCEGQGYLPDFGLIITTVAGADSSVYKVLDRDATLENFIVESELPDPPDGCQNTSFNGNNMLPATRLGDLSEFTLPFRFLE